MNTLRVSVIIPTYNRATLVVRALESALQAIQPGDEIIVVDDGSTDNTLERLEPFLDSIKLIKASHKGAGATRNHGIQEATHSLIAFLDSDDVWMPSHLNLHRKVHEAQPNISFSFSDFSVIDEKGIRYSQYIQNWHNDLRSWEEILSPSILIEGKSVYIGDMSLPELESDFIPTFTLVAKRKAIEDSHWFAEDVPTYEDLQCFGKLCFSGPAAFVDTETATQYGHLMPRLTDVSMIDKITTRIQLYTKIWGQEQTFIANHNQIYQKRLAALHLLLARALLKKGFTSEARIVLQSTDNSPIIYRILSLLPGTFVVFVLSVWSLIKK